MKHLLLIFLIQIVGFVAQAADPAWQISARRASDLKKIWVTVQAGKIVCVDESAQTKNCVTGFQAPSKITSIDTNDVISPGFMDLHNHIEFNSLPLWTGAKGQFNSRFEWREHPDYQKGPHKYFMRLMRDDEEFACQSLRWGEVKAALGGVTAIQGMGRKTNEKCAQGFATRNLESVSDMEIPGKEISGIFEVLTPDAIETGYKSFIEPHLNGEKSNYNEALETFYQNYQITEWLRVFKEEPHTLENGVRLALGEVAEPYLMQLNAPLNENTVAAFLAEVLSQESANLNITNVDQATQRIMGWLLGKKISGVSYVEIAAHSAEANKYALAFLSPDKFDRTARNFDAVLHIPRAAREWVVDMELGALTRIRNRLSSPKMLAYITHLAEGRRSDSFNSQEWDYAYSLGLVNPQLVVIHGLAMSAEQFAQAAKNNVAVVMSPLSNLLLYGETLDLRAVVNSGVLLSLGSDWSISGSKSLLDEVRVLKSIAKAQKVRLLDKDILEMLTSRAAQTLKVSDQFGALEPGYVADFVLAPKSQKTGAASVLKATPETLSLVVIKGQPVYGKSTHVVEIAKALGDKQAPESALSLVSNKSQCPQLKNKVVRFLQPDGTPESIQDMRSSLIDKMNEASESYQNEFESAESLQLDPLFACDDQQYQEMLDSYLN